VEVAKVKKAAVVTGVRNVKASKAAKSKKAVKKPKAASRKKAAKRTKATSTSRVKSISKARAKARIKAPVVRVGVKALEPQAKCGAGTSVQYLFRVDETVDGRTTTHLVFFDRHGWYCEHGRNCPAVGHAKKYQGHIARAS
jgi:ATPase subunit of ABC transporter with duplicated ATPase domains